jgi:hypothetical protein
VIALTSESHAQLFCHDWEIINLFQEPLNNANAHIQHLEQRLRQSVQDGCNARSRLYTAEIALQNALSCRKAFERHLQLEQHESRLLREKHGKVVGDLDAILTYNEMLRQELEHHQQIIESMATKLASYEGQVADPSQQPPAWWDSGIWSCAPQDGSGSTTPRANEVAAHGQAQGSRIADTAAQGGPARGLAGRGPGVEEASVTKAKARDP